MKKELTVPVYEKGKIVKGATTTVSAQELTSSLRKSLRVAPDFVMALKALDNEAWEEIAQTLIADIPKNKKLKSFVRIKKIKGKNHLSIGEPNMAPVLGIVGPALAAFAVGYAIGTACYKLGPCKFVK